MIGGAGRERIEFQLQKFFQGTPINNGVIAAVPISYKLANESTIYTLSYNPNANESSIYSYNPMANESSMNTPKEKNGSPSGAEKSITKSKPRKADFDEDVWEFVPRKRSNGRWENLYRHRKEHFTCRSLKEIERYEKTGDRPSKYKGKLKQMKSKGETSNRMDDCETEQQHLCDGQQHQSDRPEDDSEKTLSPSPIDI